jgi:hypothetical protein
MAATPVLGSISRTTLTGFRGIHEAASPNRRWKAARAAVVVTIETAP